jgi:hypothetical protein
MSKHKYSKEFLERTGLGEINPADVREKPAVVEEVKPSVNFTDKAIGMFRVKDGGGHKYTLVEIEYDPVTNTAGKVTPVFSDYSKEEMTNQFKLKVDDLNLFYYDR